MAFCLIILYFVCNLVFRKKTVTSIIALLNCSGADYAYKLICKLYVVHQAAGRPAASRGLGEEQQR